MKPERVLEMFKMAGALLEGHFVYTSGRHGKYFIQAARVLQNPEYTEALCSSIATLFRKEDVELVVGPAVGGVILSYETARQLYCTAAYTEKNQDGNMALKRGFKLTPGTRVLVVEDVITTGGSVQKTLDHLISRGANTVGVAVLVDRSQGKANFQCRFEALATLDLDSYPPDELPEELKAIPAIDPDDIIIGG